MLDNFFRRAEKNMRMRMMGLDQDLEDEKPEAAVVDAGVLFRNIARGKTLQETLHPQTPRRGPSPEVEYTPEKYNRTSESRMQDRIRDKQHRDADNKARSKALHHLLNRLIKKLPRDEEGHVIAVPDRDSLRDCSVFETSLLSMARQRLT